MCHDKTNLDAARSAPYPLVLMKQDNCVIIWIIKLAANTTLQWLHHLAKQKVSLTCFSLNKRSPKDTLGKLSFFHTIFLKNKVQINKTIMQWCFSCQNKSVCQKLAWSGKKQKSAQNAMYALFAWKPSISTILVRLINHAAMGRARFMFYPWFIFFYFFFVGDQTQISTRPTLNYAICNVYSPNLVSSGSTKISDYKITLNLHVAKKLLQNPDIEAIYHLSVNSYHTSAEGKSIP